MHPPYNILQYELFHVGAEGSLAAVMAECFERMSDSLPLVMRGHDTGSGIKTVFRIYDVAGKVTSLIHEISQLKLQREECYAAPSANFISNWYTRRRLTTLGHKVKARQDAVLAYAYDALSEAFKTSWEVAMESRDYSFRMANRNEYLDMLLAVRTTKNFWLFIFTPNELTAGKVTGVAHMM